MTYQYLPLKKEIPEYLTLNNFELKKVKKCKGMYTTSVRSAKKRTWAKNLYCVKCFSKAGTCVTITITQIIDLKGATRFQNTPAEALNTLHYEYKISIQANSETLNYPIQIINIGEIL